jgi:hypothetical protein
MNNNYTIIWHQFGAAIDMLDMALRACPGHLWADQVWDDPTDAPEFTQFWFIAYHTLMWTDIYLSGTTRKNFTPPAPFINGSLPDEPYRKEDLRAYLQYCREKCRATFEGMTDEKANQPYEFSWGGEMSFAELGLYTMRHVQEHAAQLSLHLGRNGAGAELDWVSSAGQQS